VKQETTKWSEREGDYIYLSFDSLPRRSAACIAAAIYDPCNCACNLDKETCGRTKDECRKLLDEDARLPWYR